MRTKARTIALVVVLLGGAVDAMAASHKTAKDSPIENLQPDASFSSLSLPPSEPGYLQIEDFAVIGDRIYYPHTLQSGARKIGFVELTGGKVTAQGVLPVWQPGPFSFHVSGSLLEFHDRKTSSLITIEPLSGRAVKRTRTGFSTVGSFGLLKNGLYVAASGNMLEWPVSDFRSLEGIVTDEEAIRIATRCKGGRVFLMNQNFAVSKVVKFSHKNLSAAESANREDFLGRYHVRLDETGTRFAVFSKHLPGIEVFSADGDLISAFVHPGEGRQVQAKTPLADLLRVGTRFLYQTEVLIDGDDLLIADPASGFLWRIDVATGATRAFTLPFDILTMHKVGNHLYLLGLGGRIERFLYPD